MRFAVTVPNFGAFADIRRLSELAKEAEDNGWDGFFLWDHVHFGRQPTVDPWVALTSLALATNRIRIGTMITPLPRRRPTKLAREAVSIDQLSNGRLILGVGLGAPPDHEFTRVGEEADTRVRARKLDEGLDVLRGLWSGEPFSYEGEHYRFDDVTFLPRPVQQPRIPIWVGGAWPNRAPFRRAALWDGAVPGKVGSMPGSTDPLPVEDLPEVVDYIGRHRRSAGPYDVSVGVVLPADRAEARDLVDRFSAAGATWLMDWRPDPQSLSERLRAGVPGA